MANKTAWVYNQCIYENIPQNSSGELLAAYQSENFYMCFKKHRFFFSHTPHGAKPKAYSRTSCYITPQL